MQFRYALPEGDAAVDVTPNDGGYTVTIRRSGGEAVVYRVGVHKPENGLMTLDLGGRRQRVYVAREGASRHVALGGQSWRLEPPRPTSRPVESGAGHLTAAMPGKVLDTPVEVGQVVQAGAVLVLLEAMKMELRITAPYTGVVTAIHAGPGSLVDRGQTLIDLERL